MSKHPSEMRVCFSFVAKVCAKIVVCVVPRACAKDCGIAAHTCCGIAASRNQLAALPRDRKYAGRVAACSGIAATHTTCTHVRGDASFTPPECQTTYLTSELPRRRELERAAGQSSNLWFQCANVLISLINSSKPSFASLAYRFSVRAELHVALCASSHSTSACNLGCL